MRRRSTIAAQLLACVAALLPPDRATAQYWSLGVSIGGGTTVAVHGGMHLGNTDRRRESGLTGGRTEIELVIGLPIQKRVDGGRRAVPGIGLNLRQTDRATGLSMGIGFRIVPFPNSPTTDRRLVFHIPFGWEPYPLPVRAFLHLGYGRRLVPADGGGFISEWGYFVPWPRLQFYLKHTGGFHWT